ncbi:STAS domain-containing protein [Treponema ruminis]|uniref:Anti-sigma factor antagonist n=1 Tax=Treponema ruminis TaxID=744515 RepID=A0A7W8GAY5_9SPIR|nr:STAS domain-containing protein [Treponema ruminis]MBB5227066.1 anti-sigma B factor antagonist [Treponema ruminis]
MDISKTLNGTEASIKIGGRLDTLTAPDLEKEIASITEAASLVIDCAKLEYISSAGLRVLLSAHKAFAKKGGMIVKNVNETVLDIFDVTGFKDILDIQ